METFLGTHSDNKDRQLQYLETNSDLGQNKTKEYNLSEVITRNQLRTSKAYSTSVVTQDFIPLERGSTPPIKNKGIDKAMSSTDKNKYLDNTNDDLEEGEHEECIMSEENKKTEDEATDSSDDNSDAIEDRYTVISSRPKSSYPPKKPKITSKQAYHHDASDEKLRTKSYRKQIRNKERTSNDKANISQNDEVHTRVKHRSHHYRPYWDVNKNQNNSRWKRNHTHMSDRNGYASSEADVSWMLRKINRKLSRLESDQFYIFKKLGNIEKSLNYIFGVMQLSASYHNNFKDTNCSNSQGSTVMPQYMDNRQRHSYYGRPVEFDPSATQPTSSTYYQ